MINPLHGHLRHKTPTRLATPLHQGLTGSLRQVEQKAMNISLMWVVATSEEFPVIT